MNEQKEDVIKPLWLMMMKAAKNTTKPRLPRYYIPGAYVCQSPLGYTEEKGPVRSCLVVLSHVMVYVPHSVEGLPIFQGFVLK